MASPIRPQFFCSRPNGTLTPLIALDELPAHVAVRGVPRILSPGDTQGMTSLGTVHPRAQYYVVDGASASPPRGSCASGGQSNGRAPQSDLQTSLLKVVADDSLPASQRLALHAFIQQSLTQNQVVPAGSAGPWSTANGHGNANGNGHGHAGQRQVQHQNPKKEFCSYWIRHGECDYQQQGCLYKHEMPTDPAMLEKLGLRDIPRWYRERYGIPSLLSGGGHQPRSYVGNGQLETQDRGALKAIQYPARFGMTSTSDMLPESENGLSRSRGPTYSQAAQQHTIWGQGSFRSAFAVGQPSQGAALVHRNGARQVSNGHSQSGRKFDLLSFDPMTDYMSFDGAGAGANLGEMSYPTGQVRAPTGEAERVQHDGFLHNVQSTMRGSSNVDGFLTGPCYDSASSPSRNNKRAQRSRRLYQARSHTHTHITDRELQPASEMQVLPARNNHNKTGNGAVFSVTTTSHVATSSTKKFSNGSSTAAAMSPISSGGGVGSSRMSPGSPSFDDSPSVKSHASSSSGSANMSPHTARLVHGNGSGNGSCNFGNEREREVNGASRSTLGVIGTRKVAQHKSSGCESVDDLIGLGLGRGK